MGGWGKIGAGKTLLCADWYRKGDQATISLDMKYYFMKICHGSALLWNYRLISVQGFCADPWGRKSHVEYMLWRWGDPTLRQFWISCPTHEYHTDIFILINIPPYVVEYSRRGFSANNFLQVHLFPIISMDFKSEPNFAFLDTNNHIFWGSLITYRVCFRITKNANSQKMAYQFQKRL
jgi:hypothetical protein